MLRPESLHGGNCLHVCLGGDCRRVVRIGRLRLPLGTVWREGNARIGRLFRRQVACLPSAVRRDRLLWIPVGGDDRREHRILGFSGFRGDLIEEAIEAGRLILGIRRIFLAQVLRFRRVGAFRPAAEPAVDQPPVLAPPAAPVGPNCVPKKSPPKKPAPKKPRSR